METWPDQVTRWAFGTTLADCGIATGHLPRAKLYPDTDDTISGTGVPGNGADGIYKRVQYCYNRLAEVTSMKDPSGTVHDYSYDQHGRLLHDSVSTLATGLDGTVRRISRTYDAAGRWTRVASWDKAVSDGSAAVVNEVKLETNTWGQLTADRQAHSAAVDAASPAVPVGVVGYAYADGSANHLRRTGMDPVAVADTSGAVAERYSYSAFGQRRVMDASFADQSGCTAKAWNWDFHGEFGDSATGLHNYGYRYFAPVLGRWLGRDPIGEEGGVNLMAFLGNRSSGSDLFGLSDSDYADGVGFLETAAHALEGPEIKPGRTSDIHTEFEAYDLGWHLEDFGVNPCKMCSGCTTFRRCINVEYFTPPEYRNLKNVWRNEINPFTRPLGQGGIIDPNAPPKSTQEMLIGAGFEDAMDFLKNNRRGGPGRVNVYITGELCISDYWCANDRFWEFNGKIQIAPDPVDFNDDASRGPERNAITAGIRNHLRTKLFSIQFDGYREVHERGTCKDGSETTTEHEIHDQYAD